MIALEVSHYLRVSRVPDQRLLRPWRSLQGNHVLEEVATTQQMRKGIASWTAHPQTSPEPKISRQFSVIGGSQSPWNPPQYKGRRVILSHVASEIMANQIWQKKKKSWAFPGNMQTVAHQLLNMGTHVSLGALKYCEQQYQCHSGWFCSQMN